MGRDLEYEVKLTKPALTLANLKRVVVHEGDVLVLKLPAGDLALDQIERIQTMLREAFPKNKCLILGNGTELEVHSQAG